MNILEKLKSKTKLTDDEVYRIVIGDSDNIVIEAEESGDHGRWTEYVAIIVKTIEDEYYEIWYERGLTEYQENYYEAQIARQVKPVKRMIEVIEWEEV